MSTRVLQRLIWKEYRTQRSLWLALLVAAVGIQLLMLMVSTGPSSDLDGAMFAVGILMAGFFALGSGAISFASEREDDTHIRLVSMTAPAGLTLISKLATSLFATLCFVSVASWSARLLTGDSPLSRISDPNVPALLAFLGANCLYALSCGVLCSLFCRRVITALVVGGVLHAVTSSIIFSASHGGGGDSSSIPKASFAMCVVCLAIWGVNYLIALGWLRRDFVSGPVIKPRWRFPRIRFVQIQRDGTIIVPIESSTVEELPVLKPEFAASRPAPRAFRRWRWWLFGGRGQQLFRFLVWRELVETRFWFWLGLGLILFANGTLYGGVGGLLDGHIVMPVAVREWAATYGWIAHWLIALACGWMTFRREQTDHHYLLLTYRGTPARTVWMSKQLVWLLRMTVAVAAIHGVAILGSSSSHPIGEHFLSVSTFFEQWPYPPSSYDSYVRTPISVGGLVDVAVALLGVFAVGQAFSLFVRKAVVSAFFAWIAAVLLAFWIATTGALGVPLIVTTLPLALALFASTSSYCRAWMMERKSVRVVAVPACFTIVGFGLSLAATGLFRMTEIPAIEPFKDQARLFNSPLVAGDSPAMQAARLLDPLTMPEMETAARYRQVIADFKAQSASASESASAANGQASADGSLDPKLLQFLLETAERPDCAFWHPLEQSFELPDTKLVSDFSVLIQRLLDSANQSLKADAKDEDVRSALRKQLAAFSMCRHLMGRAPRLGLHGFLYSHNVLKALREWAAHPAVTRELVDDAVARLKKIRQEMPTAEAFRVARQAYVGKLLNGDPEDWIQGSNAPHSRLRNSNPFGFVALQLGTSLPGERQRMRRLFAYGENIHAWMNFRAETQGYRHLHSGLGEQMERSNAEQSRWGRTTPLMNALLSFSEEAPTINQASPLWMDFNFETEFRATIIAMYLVAEYRGKEAPLRLSYHLPNWRALRDPWEGGVFDWFPDGVPGKLFDANLVEIAPGTPFLFSGGADQSTLLIVREAFAEGGGAGAAVPGMMSGAPTAVASPAPPGAVEEGAPPAVAADVSATETKVSYSVRFVSRWHAPTNRVQSAIITLPVGVFKPRETPAWKSRVVGP